MKKIYKVYAIGEEPTKIETYAPERAAELYGEQYDEMDPYLMLDEDNFINVIVEDEEGNKKKFKVTAWATYSYDALEIGL